MVFIEKTWKQKYHDFIENFAKENIEFLRTLPVYEKDKNAMYKPDELTGFDYLPPAHLKDEEGSIYNRKEIIEFYNQFYDKFIDIEGLTVDLNGHYYDIHGKTIQELKNEKNYLLGKERLIYEYRVSLLAEMLDAYIHLENNTKPEIIMSLVFIQKNVLKGIMEGEHCPHCNKSIYADLNYEENKIRISDHMLNHIGKEPCSYVGNKNDLKYEISLKTPSKKIAIFNSPFSFIKLKREDQYTVSICSIEGQIKDSRMYEQENIGLLPVGNTCPNIFKKGKEIIIGTIYEDDDQEYDGMIENGYEHLGDICTDLWWYTIMDYELFKKYIKDKKVKKTDRPEYILVDIGSDEITITHDLDATENETSNIFSVIKIK